jgi:hypothetical protein
VLAGVGLGGSPRAAGQAWLVGFVFASGFPLGALTLLMIGRLAGGRWVEAFGPELRRLAAWTPWLFLFIAPVLIVPALDFGWAADPGRAAPDALRLYLSPALFAVRSLAALAVWTVLGLKFGRGGPGPVAAGVGLLLHALMLILISTDWVLSIHPGWTTTNMPMIAAAAQILSAAALVLVLRRGRPMPASADLAGFVAAMVLALVYLGFMAFLIDWYADLPDRNHFLLRRRLEPWTYAPLLAVVLGVLNLSICGLDAKRYGPGRFVWAAVAALLGWFVFLMWLMGPELVPLGAGLAVIGALAQLAWLLGPPAWPGPRPQPSRRPQHA